MAGLRASNLNQQVVITGGGDDKFNHRDEVLCQILSTDCFCLQVLQFNVESKTWEQIGTLKRARAYHAVAEVNLDVLCRPVGNLNPVKTENKIIKNNYQQVASYPNQSAIGKVGVQKKTVFFGIFSQMADPPPFGDPLAAKKF